MEGGRTYTHQLNAPVQKLRKPAPEAEKEAPKKPEPTGRPHVAATEVPPMPEEAEIPEQVTVPKPRYVDYETGAYSTYEKPEHMTQLFGNKLVCKDHPRILFRGKLDALQADVVLSAGDDPGSRRQHNTPE